MFTHSRKIGDFAITGVAVTLLVLIFVVFWFYLAQKEKTVTQVAVDDAANFAQSVRQFRNFYAQEVLPNITDSSIRVSHRYKDVPNTVPLPATFTIDFGEYINSTKGSYGVSMYSDMPFKWNKDGGPKDEFEKEAMTALRANPDQPFWRIERSGNGDEVMRYAVADKLSSMACVSCHNTYEGTPKTDWKIGDVRGVLTVTRPISQAQSNLQNIEKQAFFSMVILAFISVFLLSFVMRRMKKALLTSERLSQDRVEVLEKLSFEVANKERLSEEVKGNEAKIRTIINSVQDAIIVFDEYGYIIECNDAVEQVFGYPGMQLLGRSVNVLMPDPEAGHEQDFLLRYVASETKIIDEHSRLDGLRRNGEVFPVDLTVSEIYVEGQRQFTGVIRDISERVAYENVLQDARDKAIESAKMKSEFLANMSHEIRTPMNGIIGMGNLLLDMKLTPVQKDLVDTINSSATSLLTIINDILDFSKIEAGRMEVHPLETDLTPMVEGVMDLVAEKAAASNIQVATLIAPNVPARIFVDETRLRQVLVNLVGNAVKFTLEGSVKIRVQFDESSQLLSFYVEDTGIGISEGNKQRLFEAFTQADGSTTRQFGGTGLGLGISKQLVELMGGRLDFDSKLGAGSTFFFSLPLNMEAGGHAIEFKRNDLQITLLLPHEKASYALKSCLESYGFEIAMVFSGDKLLNRLNEESEGAQLLVLDTALLSETDEQWQRSFERLKEQRTPIVWITPHAEAQHEGEGVLAYQHMSYVMKPFKLSQFAAIVNKYGLLSQSNQLRVIEEPEHEEHHNDSGQDQAVVDFKVLLVEDNLVNQKVAIALLKKLDVVPEVAMNGQEAVAMAVEHDYDLILMDCQMPVKDGYEATREIRAFEAGSRHTKIVAMTANAMEGDAERCYESGMDGYLAKPINLNEFNQVITAEIERKHDLESV